MIFRGRLGCRWSVQMLAFPHLFPNRLSGLLP